MCYEQHILIYGITEDWCRQLFFHSKSARYCSDLPPPNRNYSLELETPHKILDNTLQGRWREAQYLITTFSMISWRHDWTFIWLDITKHFQYVFNHKLTSQIELSTWFILGIFLPFFLWGQRHFVVIFSLFCSKKGSENGSPKIASSFEKLTLWGVP